MATTRRTTLDLVPDPPPEQPKVKINSGFLKAAEEKRKKEKAAARVAPLPEDAASLGGADQDASDGDGPSMSPSAADLEARTEARDARIANGDDLRQSEERKIATNPLPLISDGELFDRYLDKNRQHIGQLKVVLRRLSPNASELGSVFLGAANIEDWGAFCDYVRDVYWDGRETVYQWTITAGRLRLIDPGKLRLSDDNAKLASWTLEQEALLQAQADKLARPHAPPPAAGAVAPQGASPVTSDPKFCTDCKADLVPGKRFCAGCGVDVSRLTQRETQRYQNGGSEVLPFVERLMDRELGDIRATLKVLCEKVGAPPPASSTQAAPAQPPAPQRFRNPEGQWGVLSGDQWIPEQAPKPKLDRVMLHGKMGTMMPTEDAKAPFRWVPDDEPAPSKKEPELSAAEKAKATIADAKTQRDALNEALGDKTETKKEEEEEEDLPEGMVRIAGKKSPIVPEKLIRKYPIFSSLVGNAGDFLENVDPKAFFEAGKAFLSDMQQGEADALLKAAEAKRIEAEAQAKSVESIERHNRAEAAALDLRERRIRAQLEEQRLKDRRPPREAPPVVDTTGEEAGPAESAAVASEEEPFEGSAPDAGRLRSRRPA